MIRRFCRKLVLPLLFGSLMFSPVRADEVPFHLRCSLDTSATHGRTIYIGEYLKELKKASGGRVSVTGGS